MYTRPATTVGLASRAGAGLPVTAGACQCHIWCAEAALDGVNAVAGLTELCCGPCRSCGQSRPGLAAGAVTAAAPGGSTRPASPSAAVSVSILAKEPSSAIVRPSVEMPGGPASGRGVPRPQQAKYPSRSSCRRRMFTADLPARRGLAVPAQQAGSRQTRIATAAHSRRYPLMTTHRPHRTVPRLPGRPAALAVALLARGPAPAAGASGASAHARSVPWFLPGNLVVSRSVYTGTPAILQPGVTVLPPDCTSGCTVASNDGSYPGGWDNAAADPSFGVTSPIFLDQVTPSGRLLGTLAVPDSAGGGRRGSSGEMVTSFSSKSELALNLSTSGRQLTFMGYVARPDVLDASNANTPGDIDPTNPVGTADYRAVAEVDRWGRFRFTETNAYSGDNGRAAILSDGRSAER